MADKRYYYLKLNENFFDEETIQWLEEQENGVLYSNFYLKLCLKSLKFDGTLIRLVGETLIPYDVKGLSKLTGVHQDTVRVATELFKRIGLVKVMETGEIYMAQLDELIGAETDSAIRMRRKRALDSISSLPAPSQCDAVCDGNVTQYKSIEIEKEIDIEKDIMAENPPEYESFFEEVWNLYPNKKGKSSITKSKKKELFKVGEDLRTAVENYKEEIRILKTEQQYIKHGSTFFKTGYTDYLPGTYQKPKSTGKFAGYEQRASDYDEAIMGWSDDN